MRISTCVDPELLKDLKQILERKGLGRFRNLGNLEGLRVWNFWRA